jgi:diacylglycerol kinase (ATP)
MSQQSGTLILLNPNARDGRIHARWSEFEREVREALGEKTLRVEHTTSQDFGSGIVRAALEDGIRRIVVVGGDGTLSEAVQGFFNGDYPIAPDACVAVLPAGRGDDFFKMLRGETMARLRNRFQGDAACWADGIRILREGKALPTDLGRVEFVTADGATARRYFINLASFGYPGLVVQRVVQKRGFLGQSWLGGTGLAYGAQILTALNEYRPIEMEIRVDGKVLHTGPVFSAFVMNGSYNAGGACWSDRARIDDGLFHVTVVQPRTLLQSAAQAPRMLSGRWEGVEGVHVASGRIVEVVAEDWRSRRHPLVEVDGDLPEPPRTVGLRFEIIPGGLPMWRLDSAARGQTIIP